jgi:uncharacterized protein
MGARFETDLYSRIHKELCNIQIIDTHEHLQRERELPQDDDIHFGRFFAHYSSTDLVSAGMPREDLTRIQSDPTLSPRDRWKLLEPWWSGVRNTAYSEAIRILCRDIYDVDDLDSTTVDALTEAMQKRIRPGFTREIFDLSGIEFAMNNPFGPNVVFNPDFEFDCFIVDMVDGFTTLQVNDLSEQSGMDILSLDDYLRVIDYYFERDARCASALKIGRAYDRTLVWQDVPRSDAERVFNRLLGHNDRPDRRDIAALEDFIMHYLCQKCAEYDIRIKFHTGIHEGNATFIRNSRASLLDGLFWKYPDTSFDIYHMSYPYEEEVALLTKAYKNVTADFCWLWVGNPAVGRRTLSDMLDFVPASKIMGFGADYIFAEGVYAHAVIARREIARVLCEKVEEERFTEDYAVEVGRMLLRDNPLKAFDLERRREAFKSRAGE